MEHKKVSIIGLGLIGGSIAKALHERLGISDITVVDKDMCAVAAAVSDGTIARGFAEPNDYVYDSDIVFLCTPVKYTVHYLKLLAGRVKPECIITDVGSTKSEVVDYVNGMPDAPRFIGGHPMAGSEKNGYSSSLPHLFENAFYILTPGKNAASSDINCMEEIIRAIGAIPVIIDAAEHDRITGGISHVPHIIAAALVNMVKEMDSPEGKMQMLAAGGFKDITRIASSSPEMWESITISNKPQIRSILELFTHILGRFQQQLDSSEPGGIYNFFQSAKLFRDSLPVGKVGLITPIHEIIVDVVDKPGIIGEIATILGNNGINIKNINVSNSREFEQGCLRITLPDPGSVTKSFNLLTDRGYRVFRRS